MADYTYDDYGQANGSLTLSQQYYRDFPQYIIEWNSHYVIPDAHDIIILIIYGAIFVCSIFGNSMVCLAVTCQRDMRTITNFYIVNLAIADLLVTLFCLPLNAVNGVSMAWFFGDFMCKFLGFFPLVSMFVSIFTLMMIAVDRYLAICRPLKFQITYQRVIVVVTLIWLISFVLASPLLAVNDVHRMNGMRLAGRPNWLAYCSELHWPAPIWQQLYYVCVSCVGYLLPLTVIAAAYKNVCITLWSGIPTEEMSHSESQKLSKTSKEKSKTAAQAESRKKVARMLIVVVMIFAICLLPLQIVNLLKVFGYFHRFDYLADHNKLNTPFLIASLFTFLNSAFNPIVYNFMSAKFRKAFRAMICCQRRIRRPLNYPTATESKNIVSTRRTQANGSGLNTEYVPLSNYYNNGKSEV